MPTHSSILAWEIPWTEEPGRLQSVGLQRIGYNLATTHTCTGSGLSLPYSIGWRSLSFSEPPCTNAFHPHPYM